MREIFHNGNWIPWVIGFAFFAILFLKIFFPKFRGKSNQFEMDSDPFDLEPDPMTGKLVISGTRDTDGFCNDD